MNLRVSQSQKQTIPRGLLYVLGMLILAVGLTLSTKATLGVSPIISIAYCVSELSGVSIGDTTLLLYVVLIAVQVALHSLRKTQKWKQTSSIAGDTDIVLMRSFPEITDATETKRVGFIFPCYGGGLPGYVEEYVKAMDLTRKVIHID